VTLGLWRCTFEAGGKTNVAVLVFDVLEPVMVLVGGAVYSGREELERHYPGASELHMIGESLRVPVPITDDEWLEWSAADKATLSYRTLDEHEVRS
jgi:hypothetical protein